MFSVAKRILENIDACGAQSIKIETPDERAVLAILLYKLILVDGRIRDSELWLFRDMVQSKLGVLEDELEHFEEFVVGHVSQSREVIPFRDQVQRMSMTKRMALLSMMREISICDHEFHELEINLVMQTAELLGVRLTG